MGVSEKQSDTGVSIWTRCFRVATQTHTHHGSVMAFTEASECTGNLVIVVPLLVL